MKKTIRQFPVGFKPVFLKSCPFCGDKRPIVRYNGQASDCEQTLHVYCFKCGAGHTSINKWNERKTNFKNEYGQKLKRYPKSAVISHARGMNTFSSAKRLMTVDSGPYVVSKP